ncbi:MAG TPA: helix-turn-helix domain-containing protein [Capillimicrobium sp.]|nr:helix-turn-helix domain-containing protein [Capillimicrobium sp.]
MPDRLHTARELPTAGWRRQRESAARNEEAIRAAAAELFRREGVDDVEVRDIAAAAGVGVGTVYRRFGDKASVIAAVIGEQEQALQDALLAGPPPLGPGAPPLERLVAFLEALCRLTEENLDVLAASEGSAPGARYRVGAYAAWRLHVTVLLRDLDPGLDAAWYAELLLAPMAAHLYRQQRREQGMSAERIAANVVEAARRLVGG